MVPQDIIELGRVNPKIFCNLDPEQRPPPTSEEEKARWQIGIVFNTIWVDEPVMRFLKTLHSGEMVLLLSKWLDCKNVTSVLTAKQVYWDSCGYPRLDLKLPRDLVTNCGPKPFLGVIDLWGAFIVAIARANQLVERIHKEDPDLSIFKKLAGEVVI